MAFQRVKHELDGLAHSFLFFLGFPGFFFVEPFYAGVLNALITLALYILVEHAKVKELQYGNAHMIKLNNAVWTAITFLLGFLLVFRVSQAYGRYWSALTSVHTMRAEWYDAFSALCSFTRVSTLGPDRIKQFHKRLEHIFSLLDCTALMALMEADLGDHFQLKFDHDGLRSRGFDKETMSAYENCPHKVDLVYAWVQNLIVQSLGDGLLTIAPPILTRCFHQLSKGMVSYHDAMKVKAIPFPLPYEVVCKKLLHLHWGMTPFVLTVWVSSPLVAMLFAYVTVFFMWSVLSVAKRIEDPFALGIFSDDAVLMHMDMNQRLAMLASPQGQAVPNIIIDAREFDEAQDSPVLMDQVKSNLWEVVPTHHYFCCAFHRRVHKRRVAKRRKQRLHTMEQIYEENPMRFTMSKSKRAAPEREGSTIGNISKYEEPPQADTRFATGPPPRMDNIPPDVKAARKERDELPAQRGSANLFAGSRRSTNDGLVSCLRECAYGQKV